ncbi:MAG: argininosuccinate lyase [Planctomycetaceae bacterium]|nr:argininosuccinate lyase [Planctomycetales bacterium]MCB9923431.1 argininosuccinate lyase [Planctomycetaceae bacterium]
MSTPSRSGVFGEGPNRLVEQFTESVSFDHRLYAQDVAGSIAHSQMLAENGIISRDEQQLIEHGLLEIRAEIAAGNFELRTELEDIHMHIEKALIDRLGDVGRKLHSGRSRNDQVATDFRLWVRDAIDDVDKKLVELQRAFVSRCDRDADVILPAYTHLQRAQPVLAPHYWLAYCEKFERDRQRLQDCRRRVNVSTLGTAAVAGTTLQIDRHDVARRLGFEGVSANSIDSSSDRDFVLETAFVLTMIAEHLSTLAEEWVLWSTVEFNFIKLPQAFCTGSSIMPQKINPDVMELIRGKTARVVGSLHSLLVLVKGLPLAYNRDLQEDKPQLFDAVDTVSACLEIAAPVVQGAELNRDSITAGLDRGYLDATTFMEYLIRRNIPQRTAHHLVGQLVRKAIDKRVSLSELPLSDYQEAHPDLDDGVYEVLGAEKAIDAFVSYGSTASVEVAKQVERWKKKLETKD